MREVVVYANLENEALREHIDRVGGEDLCEKGGNLLRRLPEDINHKLHLCGRVPSAIGVHARGKQALFQPGGGAYPFVQPVDGSLLGNARKVVHGQFAFPVAADGETGLCKRIILFHHYS